jgi:hypothetical protein
MRLMGFPTSEVGYTSATAGRGDHEVSKGHVVALGKTKNIETLIWITTASSFSSLHIRSQYS